MKRIILLLVFTIFFALCSPANPANAQEEVTWEPVPTPGIYGERIEVFTPNPVIRNVIFLGSTNNGLYRSVDGGLNWQVVLSPEYLAPVTSIAIGPDDGRTIFASGKPGGVFRSNDMGLTWIKVGEETFNGVATAIGTNPFTGRYVYLASDSGFYRSSDFGETWENVGLTESLKYLFIHPDHAGIMFTSSATHNYRSSDYGSTWTVYDNSYGTIMIAAAYDPFNPDTIIATGNDMNGLFTTNAVTANGWTRKIVQVGGWNASVGSIYIDKFTQGLWYVSFNDVVVKTTNSGTTWAFVEDGGYMYIYGKISGDPFVKDKLYLYGNHQLRASLDDARTWSFYNQGLKGPQITALALDPNNHDIRYAFVWGAGLYKTINAGTNWVRIDTGVPPGMVSTRVAINPYDTNQLYILRLTTLYRSGDGGQTWTAWDPTTDPSSRENNHAITFDPINQNKVYLSRGDGMFRSNDSGVTWQLVPSFPTGFEAPRSMIFSVDENENTGLTATVYAHSPRVNALVRTIDDGQTWQTVYLPEEGFSSTVYQHPMD